VWLDFIGCRNVPHVESRREHDDGAGYPVVVDKEVAVLHPVYIHFAVEGLVGRDLEVVPFALELFHIEAFLCRSRCLCLGKESGQAFFVQLFVH